MEESQHSHRIYLYERYLIENDQPILITLLSRIRPYILGLAKLVGALNAKRFQHVFARPYIMYLTLLTLHYGHTVLYYSTSPCALQITIYYTLQCTCISVYLMCSVH